MTRAVMLLMDRVVLMLSATPVKINEFMPSSKNPRSGSVTERGINVQRRLSTEARAPSVDCPIGTIGLLEGQDPNFPNSTAHAKA